MSKNKITELTPEQEAQLDVYTKKWIDIGLDTKPIDRDLVKSLVEVLYNQHKDAMSVSFSQYAIEFFDSPYQIQDKFKIGASDFIYGNNDAAWLAYYDFMRTELGLVEETEELMPLMNLSKEIGWAYITDRGIFISEKPNRIILMLNGTENKYEGISHFTEGPNITFRDGTALYALDDRPLSEKDYKRIFDPKTTPKEILSIENTEIRLLSIKYYGMERLLKALDYKVVDQTLFCDLNIKSKGGDLFDVRNDDYALIKTSVEGIPLTILRMKNPSEPKIHFEYVTEECMTVKQANACALGFDDINEDYEVLVQV